MINFKAAMCIDSGERDSCSPCGFLTLSDEYSLDHYYRNDNCFIGKGTTVTLLAAISAPLHCLQCTDFFFTESP
jgi:hypothetical protein